MDESGTARGLLTFFGRAAKRGDMPSATAGAYASAARKLLEIDGEGWEVGEVKAMDVDEQFKRFETLRHSEYKPETLRTYRTRFEKALNLYLTYLNDPSGFRFSEAAGARPKQRSAASNPRVPSSGSVVEHHEGEEGARPPGASNAAGSEAKGAGAQDVERLIVYPFPLRPGVLAELQLPPDLRRSEADRLRAYISALAIDGDGGKGANEAD